jgi:serine/threonine protein kinase
MLVVSHPWRCFRMFDGLQLRGLEPPKDRICPVVAVTMSYQIACGLKYLHARYICHRFVGGFAADRPVCVFICHADVFVSRWTGT